LRVAEVVDVDEDEGGAETRVEGADGCVEIGV